MTSQKNCGDPLTIKTKEDHDINLTINNIDLSGCKKVSREICCDFDFYDIKDNKNIRSSIVSGFFCKQNTSDKVKLTILERYGVEHESQSKEVNKINVKKSERYDVDYNLQSQIDIIEAGC